MKITAMVLGFMLGICVLLQGGEVSVVDFEKKITAISDEMGVWNLGKSQTLTSEIWALQPEQIENIYAGINAYKGKILEELGSLHGCKFVRSSGDKFSFFRHWHYVLIFEKGVMEINYLGYIIEGNWKLVGYNIRRVIETLYPDNNGFTSQASDVIPDDLLRKRGRKISELFSGGQYAELIQFLRESVSDGNKAEEMILAIRKEREKIGDIGGSFREAKIIGRRDAGTILREDAYALLF